MIRILFEAFSLIALILLGYGVLENQRHNGILLGIAAKHEALLLKQANDQNAIKNTTNQQPKQQ
tara:strand:- start:1030 stop:1221 length:192 start_codon:yes stop_codon:yes gene_type:complete